MKIAIYGGSFSPCHFSHMTIISWLLATEQVEQVWMIPCFKHMFGKKMIEFSHRYEMCKKLAEFFGDRCQVSDIEKKLGGASRSLRTIRVLKKKFPEHEFKFVIGIDNWKLRDQWKDLEVISKEFELIVMGTKNQPKIPRIRSTMIRKKIEQNKDISVYLPKNVLDYILLNNLYRNSF